jgi:hypothetical protein
MSDNPTAGGSQEESAATPLTGTTSAPVVDPTSIEALPASWQKEIKALRKEAETYRRAAKEREQADLSEAQRLKQQLDDLAGTHSAALQELRSLKAQGIARDAGALYPDLVADKLSDEALNGDKPTRDKEIDRLRKTYPQLFRVGSSDGGTRGETTTGDMNQLLRRAAGRTS